ncbi:MAG TPA: glycosyl hydrolase, partial [Candidatus Cloacimonadota bacterium]|nr:glycosyl hydrolase [Candidatus Cloacimonadota bacterium]
FLKKTTEGAFASGVNHMAMHQWVLQPFDDRYQPGMGMGWWGTHFSRHQPWIKPGKAFFEYITRSQYLLQQGEQVIDFLALDEVSDQITDAVATIDFLKMEVNVKDRHIVLPSGRKYALMQFSQGKSMLPEVLDKIGELLEHGAIIVAQKPEESLSLTNYPACDEYIKSKAETLWKKYAGKQIFSKREDAMLALCLTPDYQVFEGDAHIVHRHSPEAEIYYIGNLTDKKQTVTVSLRIKDMYPELWNTQTGIIEHIDNMKDIDNSSNMVKGAYWSFENNRTLIRMTLFPYQSHFIIMRRKATEAEIKTGSADKPALTKSSTVQLRNGWNVHFEPKLDKAFDMKMDTLSDFSLSTDDRVKYFTGTATYRQTITISQNKLSEASQIWFDLDSMNDIAVLKINGISVDTLWYPPYRTEITRYLKKGKNAIEVLVTNNWANRMIGDEQYPADFEWGKDRGAALGRAMKGYPEWFLKGQPRPQKGRKAFAVWYYYRKDSPLQKAGLVGPVNMEFWK